MPHWKIGELSARVAVPIERLRGWERRYRLLDPVRSASGHRLYGPDDEQRVFAMKGYLEAGVSPAEAAALVRRGGAAAPTSRSPGPSRWVERLSAATVTMDEAVMHEVLDQAVAALPIEEVTGAVIIPYLVVGLPQALEQHALSSAHLAFAAMVVRSRLASLTRNWSTGSGPAAVLATPPGEQWELGLTCIGLCMRTRGWRIVYLGPRVAIGTLVDAAQAARAVVVLTATVTDHFSGVADDLARLASEHRLYLADRGANASIAREIGATFVAGDPPTAAAAIPLPRQRRPRPRGARVT